jgi:hypothetical protein
MNLLCSRKGREKNFWRGLVASGVLSFVVTGPAYMVGRSYGLDLWSFLPFNVIIGCTCGFVAALLFPVTPAARDDEGGGRRA